MCGRFALRYPSPALARMFQVQTLPELRPRFNIAPSQEVLVVRVRPGHQVREAVLCRWGLVPHWAKDPGLGNRLINARAETVFEKPAFRAAAKHSRCLIPADAFFEWHVHGTVKRPHVLTLATQGVFAFAGLWESWNPSPDQTPLETCVILTRPAVGEAATIHDRMPVILDPAGYASWLNPANQDPAALSRLLMADPPDLTATPVSLRVNNPGHDDASVMDPP